MALNALQRSILEGSFRFPFGDIKEFTFGDEVTFEDGIDNDQALTALQLILADDITPLQTAKLEEWDVLGSVNQFRDILAHPAPQNRAVNYPYFSAPADDTQVVYRGEDGLAHFEAKGLLGLS